MVGIHAFGGYIPRLRLQRQAVFAATGWFASGLRGLAKGERSVASWDEDSITMAVEAARDCLGRLDRGRVSRVNLASTSLPNADRQNSTVVKEALNLSDEVAAFDVVGSQRAGTSVLLNAFYATAGGAGDILCIGSERSVQKPGSEAEMTSGHGAAAVLVSEGEGAACFLGGHSVSIDFVDHFRAEGQQFDYQWEARWVREEGYGKIVPSAIKEALQKLGLSPRDVTHFILPSPMRGVNASVAKKVGIAAEAVVDTLAGSVGDTGVAQPLVLLSHVLERAGPDETVLVVGFGGGCDVIVLRTTQRVRQCRPQVGIGGSLEDRQPVDNYIKYLAFAGLLELDKGMRAELDQKPILTALYRERKTVLGLVGGKCRETGTVQFPKSPISVAHNARTVNTQDDYPLADLSARVISYTADNLTYTPDPPGYYGGIEFDGGGRIQAEFTDVGPEGVEVGMPVRMVFRIKAKDERRHFTKYFWKAVPDRRRITSSVQAA